MIETRLGLQADSLATLSKLRREAALLLEQFIEARSESEQQIAPVRGVVARNLIEFSRGLQPEPPAVINDQERPANRVLRIPVADRRNDNCRAPLVRLDSRGGPAGLRKRVRLCNEYEWRNRCANRSGPRRRERMNRFNFDNVGSSQFGQLWESELFSRGCRDDEFELIADLLSAKAVDDAPNRREVICDNSDSKLRSSRCGSGHRWANGLFLCHALSLESWFEILGKAALPTRFVNELAVVAGYASASEIFLPAMEAIALQIFADPISNPLERFLDVLD